MVVEKSHRPKVDVAEDSHRSKVNVAGDSLQPEGKVASRRSRSPTDSRVVTVGGVDDNW